MLMLMLMSRRPVAPQAGSSGLLWWWSRWRWMTLFLVMLKRAAVEEEGKGAEVFSGSGTARKTEKKT